MAAIASYSETVFASQAIASHCEGLVIASHWLHCKLLHAWQQMQVIALQAVVSYCAVVG